jgi:hypothetical protein
MSSFTYRDKKYDAAKLVTISGLGADAKIDVKLIDKVFDFPCTNITVVANGDRYDMFGGTLFKNKVTGEPSPFQGVKLLSKHVLKKALFTEPVAAPPIAAYEPRRNQDNYPRTDYSRRDYTQNNDRSPRFENTERPTYAPTDRPARRFNNR